MKIIVCHSALTNGTAGLLISLITCSETAVPTRIGSFSLYFPDCMFGEDRSRLQSGARLVKCKNPKGECIGQASKLSEVHYLVTILEHKVNYAVIDIIHTLHKQTVLSFIMW